MEDEPELNRRHDGARQSIQMLRAVVDGDIYETVAAKFGISRTAVERPE